MGMLRTSGVEYVTHGGMEKNTSDLKDTIFFTVFTSG
jgi:hypothetical protein